MIQTIKNIVTNNIRKIAIVLCVFCLFGIGLSLWLFVGKDTPAAEPHDQRVPSGEAKTAILAGDVVVLNIFADKMDDVYGYQFDINYDKDYFEYRQRLHSDINAINTIFAVDKEWFLLVGATMMGDARGYSGQTVLVCRVEFTALKDFDLPLDHISISRVNVATGDLQYLENINGWTVKLDILQP